jgi:alpha-amylase/alpha-mannosidase (GH57 family)
MHQPYYKDTITGEYSLPWARLHALKDYLHMAEMVAEQPDAHVTFNYVPCLVEQLQEYADGRAIDHCLALTLQESWSAEDKAFMLSLFFSINIERFIKRYPRYWQLYELAQRAENQAELFSDAYYRDLAAWFNLIWIDRALLEQDETLRMLVEKGRNFSPSDLKVIIAKQREIIARVLPRYRELESRGQIEISASPYYHPILPLLADLRSAREASPRLRLPSLKFAYPEDALEQLRRGASAHERYFGRRPRGVWPSEGSVGQQVISLIQRANGFTWIASDEGILANSLNTPIQRDAYGHVLNPRFLYRPYRLQVDALSHPLQIVFRDIVLSDRIGFVYKHMSAADAANDLIQRLQTIRHNLNDTQYPYLVPIILDGENCWEEYEDNGTPFLRALYQRLAHEPGIKSVTLSEYLDKHPATETIPRLFSGSWINHNLETWIGEEAQNRAWEYLARTRQWLTSWQHENSLTDLRTLETAWEEVYIAEGSDWFWWYYSRNHPAGENLFDHDFRRHLRNVYQLMGVAHPTWLDSPIRLASSDERKKSVSGYVSPTLGIAEKASNQWQGAGYIEPETSTGAMQRAESGIRRLYYGYDQENLYFRIESAEDLSALFVGIYLSLPDGQRANQRPRYTESVNNSQLPSAPYHKEIALRGWTEPVILSSAGGQEIWQQQMTLSARLDSHIGEVKTPLSALDVQMGDLVSLVLVVAKDDRIIQTLPSADLLILPLELLA